MRDRPVPSVMVTVNAFFPPNQPTVRRCHAFGQSILRAIQSWESDARVALIASGGLTHFVIDETVDQTTAEKAGHPGRDDPHVGIFAQPTASMCRRLQTRRP